MAADKSTDITHVTHKSPRHDSSDVDKDGLVLVNRLNQSRSPYVGLSLVVGQVI